jgi:hypothetical protein
MPGGDVSRIRIRTRNGEYLADLDDSDISNAIWLSLPYTAGINMLGGQIYFEMPLKYISYKDPVTKFDIGDVAYWPKVGALCFFFGPTPLSGDDGLPVSHFPLIKVGELTGEFSTLEDAGDRQNITLERAF